MAARVGDLKAWAAAAVRDGWGWNTASSAGWVELIRNYAEDPNGDVRLELVTPSAGDQNPFGAAQTAGELLEALELYAAALRLRYRWSPGATGLALMRAVHSGPGGVKLPELAQVAPVALAPAEFLAPAQGLTKPRRAAAGWLHAFDVNAMFLAACSSIELGFGAPVTSRDIGPATLPPAAPGADWKPAPGYYLATVTKTPPAWPFSHGTRRRWYPAPALAYAAEVGAKARIYQVWAYPERHRWLEPWYERLRDARAALAAETGPAGLIARAALKRTYAAALGRLAGSWLEVGDATFRPDWRHAVIARAFANLHRHLAHVAAHSGAWPIAQDLDLVIYASDLADPVQAAAELGLELSPALGKWKVAGTMPAPGAPLERRELLRAIGAR
jgi:hypothetical protein